MNNDRHITLTDETGTEEDFLFLDLISYHGEEYIVLIHPNEKEVIILKISGDTESGEEVYISVDDDRILEEVYAAFKERNEDSFIFIE